MRNGLLTLLVVLSVGEGMLLAQPSPSSPYSSSGTSVGIPAPPVVSEDRPASSPGGESPSVQPPYNAPPDPVLTSEVDVSPYLATAPDPYSDFIWFRADYLMWWTKNGPVPTPLLTTGSLTDPVPGAIGQPNTRILFGDQSVDYGTTSGMRFEAGTWLDQERLWGIEGGYFLLQTRSSNFAVASDAGGNPLIGQPLVFAPAPQEFVEAISIPTLIAGGAAVSTQSRLQGWEVNTAFDAFRGQNFNFYLLAGFRALDLDEDLDSAATFNQLQNGNLSFLGTFLNGPVSETTLDHFGTQNHFYGAQLGGRLEWSVSRFNISAMGKVALGDNQQLVEIAGSSTLTTPGGATTTAPGGVLALSSNSGRFFRDQFSVVPEIGIQVGYQVTEHMEAHVGYSFLYWNNVARPGDQIDRVVEPALIPTDPGFGTATGTRPAFQFHNTDYWAQGVNFGVEFHY